MKTLIILGIVYIISVILCYITIKLTKKNPKGKWYGLKITLEDIIICLIPISNTMIVILNLPNWKDDKYSKDYSKFFIILLILSIISCKKADIKITNQPKQPIQLCIIDTVHFFEGKYISNKIDTIVIKYLNSECLHHNQTQYSVHNMKNSFARQKEYRVEDKDYIMTANEYAEAFSGGIVQLIYIQDNIFSLSLALNDTTYALKLIKL